jgi:CBS domain-containing protein
VAQVSASDAQVVGDVMLRDPKTLPWDATVAAVRAVLASPSVQLVLLTEGTTFKGAVAAIPDDAQSGAFARDYREVSPDTIAVSESAATAFDMTARNLYRRVVVIDEHDTLLGLVCLDQTRTRFCGRPSR